MDRESSDSRGPRWLGPGELARRLGLSIKALRVYERAGLVAPGRREGGWRSYGPRDVARLHEVLALRNLGLSLAEVKAVLDAPDSGLQRTLEIQQRHLAAQIGAAQKRLAAVNAARRRLREEGSLGLDELIALAGETAAVPGLSAGQVEAIVHGLASDHDGAADLDRFHDDMRSRLVGAGLDPADFERLLSQLVADAAAAAATADPGSPRGRALAERWLGLVAPLALGAQQAGEGAAAFASRLSDNPDLAAALAFLRRAVAIQRASER